MRIYLDIGADHAPVYDDWATLFDYWGGRLAGIDHAIEDGDVLRRVEIAEIERKHDDYLAEMDLERRHESYLCSPELTGRI